MKLYLIRHAESENNAAPTYRRVEDPSLTAIGRLQAEYLAKWLRTLRADVFITSPFRRTLETATAILQEVPWQLRIWHNVFERGGCFRGFDESSWEGAPGLGKSGIERLLGDFRQRCRIDDTISEQGWWHQRNKESDPEAVERASQVCSRLEEEFSETETVVLLIHADLKRLMMDRMLGGEVDVTKLGNLRNVGITRFNRTHDGWQLDYFNSVSHLPSKLITGNEH